MDEGQRQHLRNDQRRPSTGAPRTNSRPRNISRRYDILSATLRLQGGIVEARGALHRTHGPATGRRAALQGASRHRGCAANRTTGFLGFGHKAPYSLSLNPAYQYFCFTARRIRRSSQPRAAYGKVRVVNQAGPPESAPKRKFVTAGSTSPIDVERPLHVGTANGASREISGLCL